MAAAMTGADIIHLAYPHHRTTAQMQLKHLGAADCREIFVESFWARLQVELLNRQRWNTRVELANAIFEYIEGFHNRCSRHSALGWQTPLDFEQTYHRQLASPHS